MSDKKKNSMASWWGSKRQSQKISFVLGAVFSALIVIAIVLILSIR